MTKNGNYGVWFPSDNFSVKDRFFFFLSLYNKNKLTDDKGRSGKTLAQEVSNGISKNLINKINIKDENGKVLIENVLKFLQQTIDYERKQEIAYFQDKLNKANLSESLKKEFQPLFNLKNDQPFDYPKFINLINILSTGKDNYEKLLQYEKTRLKQLNDLINKYLEDENEHYTRGTFKDPGNKDLGFYSNFRDYAIRTKNYWANNTSTFSNNVQKVLQEAVETLWNSAQWQETLFTYLENNFGNRIKQRNVQQILTINLMNQVIKNVRNKIIDIFKFDSENPNFSKIINKTVLKEIIESSATQFIKDLDKNSSPQASTDFLEDLIKQIELLEDSELTNDTKRYLKIVSPVTLEKRKNGTEVIKIAKDVKDAMIKEIRKKGRINKSAKNDELIEKFLKAYSGLDDFQISTVPIEEKIDIIKNFSSSFLPLIDFYIAGKDNIVSEIFATGNFSQIPNSPYIISKIGLEGGYQKADVYGVENIPLGSYIFKLNNSNLQNVCSNLAKNITKQFFDSTEIQPVPINQKTELFNELEYRRLNEFGRTEFSISAETKRRLIYLKKICNDTEKKLQEEKMSIEQIDEFIKQIKDTIQISTTVKSYNKYKNNEGFHGGSLGGSVENQLKNIYDMYSYGGITLPDIEWMTLAVYNSGSNMIGKDNKNIIENILSAVTGMLLFDDAGEQALYIQSQLNKNIEYGTSKFLHLYYLNDFYFPSSYILSLTYKGLYKAYNILNEEFKPSSFLGNFKTSSSVSGAKIIIENNISEIASTDESSDWNTFFSNNKEKVSINIVFLAGLLDIIDILNSSLQK